MTDTNDFDIGAWLDHMGAPPAPKGVSSASYRLGYLEGARQGVDPRPAVEAALEQVCDSLADVLGVEPRGEDVVERLNALLEAARELVPQATTTELPQAPATGSQATWRKPTEKPALDATVDVIVGNKVIHGRASHERDPNGVERLAVVDEATGAAVFWPAVSSWRFAARAAS